ncbi:MAG: M23 family metallopeptidase [Candidatus Heimdallarchaeota archaeon]|nr:M23 family metallopeptidase [Candidatus Heimdallarchaeota archaeon]
MKKQACVIGIVVIIVVAAVIVFTSDLDQLPVEAVFDNEGRYDSTRLNNMGVIYANQSDIAFWNDGYSESDTCPWGFIHNGLDFFFTNNSVVIAAAPGLVENISLGYLPASTIYSVGVKIRFNSSLTVEYGFEGDSPDEAIRAQQAAMLDIEIGDWVAKGDQIGRFLRPTQYDHIHFGVYQNDEAFCPRQVMGEDDYNEIMNLIQTFHPIWELCYH